MQQLTYRNWPLEIESQWIGPSGLDNDYHLYIRGKPRQLFAVLNERLVDGKYTVTAKQYAKDGDMVLFSKTNLEKLVRQLLPKTAIRTARIEIKEE